MVNLTLKVDNATKAKALDSFRALKDDLSIKYYLTEENTPQITQERDTTGKFTSTWIVRQLVRFS